MMEVCIGWWSRMRVGVMAMALMVPSARAADRVDTRTETHEGSAIAAGAIGEAMPGPRPAIDLKGLATAALTAAQREAVDDYRRVRGEYDAFIAESSALVARMEAATGPARMEALNALRARRMPEQALEARLRRSEQTLLAVLGSELQRGGPHVATDDAPPAAAGAEYTVMLIDTAMFHARPELSDRQREAVSRYDAAAEACRTALETGDDAVIQPTIRRLSHAERDLLNAFPEVVVEE